MTLTSVERHKTCPDCDTPIISTGSTSGLCACNSQYDAALCKMAEAALLPATITDPLTIIHAYAVVGR